MNTVLYLSASGASYETRAYTTADITELVNAQGLQALTSADRPVSRTETATDHASSKKRFILTVRRTQTPGSLVQSLSLHLKLLTVWTMYLQETFQ